MVKHRGTCKLPQKTKVCPKERASVSVVKSVSNKNQKRSSKKEATPKIYFIQTSIKGDVHS